MVFRLALAAQVFAGAGRAGMQGAHVQQAADAGFAAGLDDVDGQFFMHLAEAVAAGFIENADQVDDGIAASEVPDQCPRIVNIRFDQ